MPLCKAFAISGISKHQYYYKRKISKQGVKPSQYTETVSGKKIDNQVIVDEIKKIHGNPDTVYGYIKTTYQLKTMGYKINKKKVYRLMKAHNLLGKRYGFKEKTYAKYRKVLPEEPLQVLEMDIKFVWVEQVRRHAYILSVVDTFTRVVLYHTVSFSITKKEVKKAWEYIIINHLQPNDCLNRKIDIEIRNDNDKRFSAETIRDFFKENQIRQIFTHPYTPQENGHIESFHAILSRHLKPYNFWSLEELEQNLILFYEFYNNNRIHGSIAYTNPQTFWLLWKQNKIEINMDEKKKKISFKLKIPYHQIYQYTGNNEPEGSSLLDFEKIENNKKMISAEAS
ncbi:MAG: DDE-type integrase/transposase/recombinase [Bacteroidales bacterium]|nr:DDE-type integrase/transposase/recombinase [Bacteroidales bacterium]